jgi:hypothetical protein
MGSTTVGPPNRFFQITITRYNIYRALGNLLFAMPFGLIKTSLFNATVNFSPYHTGPGTGTSSFRHLLTCRGVTPSWSARN